MRSKQLTRSGGSLNNSTRSSSRDIVFSKDVPRISMPTIDKSRVPHDPSMLMVMMRLVATWYLQLLAGWFNVHVTFRSAASANKFEFLQVHMASRVTRHCKESLISACPFESAESQSIVPHNTRRRLLSLLHLLRRPPRMATTVGTSRARAMVLKSVDQEGK